MSRAFAISATIVCLGFAVAGCGSAGSSISTGASAPSGSPGQTTGAGTSTQPGSTAPSGGSGAPSAGSESSGGGSSRTPEGSIESYGAAAGGTEKAAIAAAARAFFAAMSTRDYAGVCADLSAPNQAQLQAFLRAGHRSGGCPAILKTLVPPAEMAAARRAAAGAVNGVRVKGDTAFVLFRPKGGAPSYFVLKREGGAWKAIGLAPGTPLRLPSPPAG